MDRVGWCEYGSVSISDEVPVVTGGQHEVEGPRLGDLVHNGLSWPSWKLDVVNRGLAARCVHRAGNSDWDIYEIVAQDKNL